MTDTEITGIKMAEEWVCENGFCSDCNNLTSFDANIEMEKAFLAGLKAGEEKAKKEIEEELLKCYRGY